MVTIITRTHKDRSKSYTAQIFLKRDLEIVQREAKTFERRRAALSWMARRDDDLNAPGGMNFRYDRPLADVITRYENESNVYHPARPRPTS